MNILSIKIVTKNKNIFKIDLTTPIENEVKRVYYDLKINTKLKVDIQNLKLNSMAINLLIGEYVFINDGFSLVTSDYDNKIRFKFNKTIDDLKNTIFIKTDNSPVYIDIASFLLMLNMSYTFERDKEFISSYKWLYLDNNINKNRLSVEYIKDMSGEWVLADFSISKQEDA